jgi:hypothetical protein
MVAQCLEAFPLVKATKLEARRTSAFIRLSFLAGELTIFNQLTPALLFFDLADF